ncbi:AzlC family ABC transporter permease [Thermincola potens]|uniref:AzlC family protein n=1 Tax=Thermincola potens (strain JR) TaxID=635013 RepID=D5XDD7_THEPJ|nr:AzlC family ABC transporter permease [Thermincola potens]ADG81785.1 AzlC family protein [Thermincola potens JR]
MSRATFLAGGKKALPIMLGYTPLGIAFGVIAREKGLDVVQTALMSLTSFTGSGQFIAVGMLGAGASIPAILLTNFLVNLRYLLFSASMAPYVKKMPTWVQSILAFGITDETFTLNMAQFDKQEADRDFMLGVNFFSHLSWITNSAIGAALGNIIPDMDRFGVNFALPAMFIALLVMQVKNRINLWVAVISGLLSLTIALFTDSSVNIIIATVIAAAIGVVLCRDRQKSTF